ncbi:hypothetical protein Tco_0049319, partial [Tanacetum coccineum]
AQIKKLKKKAKPVITHHRAWIKSVSLKQRLAGKKSLKKQWMQKESISKQGRKPAKVEPLVHKDPLFDELANDTLDYIDTENAQDVGRTRNVVYEEKESAEDAVSTEDVVSADKEKVSTDRPDEGTDDQTKGRSATPTTPTPTPTTFGDDETISQVLLNMSQAKAVSREKEKGVELKDETEEERKGLAEEEATNAALIQDFDDIKARMEADKADRLLALRLLALRLQEEKREQFTVEERAKFLHDTIAAQRRFLAEHRAIV